MGRISKGIGHGAPGVPRKRYARAEEWPLLPEQEPPRGACAIRLTKRRVAWVDEADHPGLAEHNWHCSITRATWYAVRTSTLSDGVEGEPIRMHRVIMQPGAGEDVDHREHYPTVIDNRRQNLRTCDRAHNLANRGARCDQVQSCFIGVMKHGQRWRARVRGPYGRKQYQQNFREEWHAALARDLEAYKRYGDFARLNFNIPKPGEPRFLPTEGPADTLTL